MAMCLQTFQEAAQDQHTLVRDSAERVPVKGNGVRCWEGKRIIDAQLED